MDNGAIQHNINEYLCRMKDGDSESLAPLYDCTVRHLYALCFTYFHNRPDSEDAVSETYLKIQTNIQKFNGTGGYMWMCTIAKNICLNMLKASSRIVSTDFTDDATLHSFGDVLAEQPEDRSGEDALVSMAREILREKEFRIVILRVVSGENFRDIARVVDTNEATVRWQYHNALKKLQKECERRGIR